MGGITLQDVGKVYASGVTAVAGVSLDVADGEFVVFVGPSGCGKSTLLRMIAGLETITTGEVRIDGVRVNEVHARDRDIAMVFQNYALYPRMTVRENISFALQLRRMAPADIAARVDEAARMLDLGGLLDRRPGELSGGQRQRVAMGRALVRDPKVFLLDEPLSNLDAKLRVQLRAELGRLHGRLGVTTIHVTHDQIEAMTLGTRIAVFSAGRLMQYDTPHALYHAPRNLFVAGFIGSPAMNFLAATAVAGGADIGGTIVTADHALAAGAPLIVGLRPEHLRWQAGPGPGAFAAAVELVEHLEPEAYVIARPLDGVRCVPAEGAAAPSLTLRCPADSLPDGRGTIWVTPDLGRAHLFDPATGLAIGRPG
jgi:ABC-type sugar transport system ATPase subunit